MAYSIYFTLKDEGVGRNIEYIAYNTGVNSKQLWKCESLDTNISIPISIESLLSKGHRVTLRCSDNFKYSYNTL